MRGKADGDYNSNTWKKPAFPQTRAEADEAPLTKQDKPLACTSVSTPARG